MDRDEIVDRLGADSWEMVVAEFGAPITAGDYQRIARDIDAMFPNDDNGELIAAVQHQLSR